MSQRIYLKGAVFNSYCTMDQHEIEAAEISDVRDVRGQVTLLASEVQTDRQSANAWFKELHDQSKSHAAWISNREQQLAQLEATCKTVYEAVAPGGKVQQIFQGVTDDHFRRVNQQIAEFHTRADNMVRQTEALLGQVKPSAGDLRESADRLTAQMKHRNNELHEQAREAERVMNSVHRVQAEAQEVVRQAQLAAMHFEAYRKQARWDTFWGRLRWLFTGVS